MPHPTSWISILILSSNLCMALNVVSFPQVFPPNPRMHLSSPHVLHGQISHSSRYDHPNNVWWIAASEASSVS
jgi:hypothetical protein